MTAAEPTAVREGVFGGVASKEACTQLARDGGSSVASYSGVRRECILCKGRCTGVGASVHGCVRAWAGVCVCAGIGEQCRLCKDPHTH